MTTQIMSYQDLYCSIQANALQRLTLRIVPLHVLQHLNVARYLLTGAQLASLAPDVVRNELVSSARFSVDHDLPSSKLRDPS